MARSYAYVCTLCMHLLSNHTLARGDDEDGLYRCAHCTCERSGDGDDMGLSRAEFEAYMAAPDTPPNIWTQTVGLGLGLEGVLSKTGPSVDERSIEVQVGRVLDVEEGDLVRLVLALAEELEVYDPTAGDFDEDRPMQRELDGGAGLVPLHLDDRDLATLREVLDCEADIRRAQTAASGTRLAVVLGLDLDVRSVLRIAELALRSIAEDGVEVPAAGRAGLEKMIRQLYGVGDPEAPPVTVVWPSGIELAAMVHVTLSDDEHRALGEVVELLRSDPDAVREAAVWEDLADDDAAPDEFVDRLAALVALDQHEELERLGDIVPAAGDVEPRSITASWAHEAVYRRLLVGFLDAWQADALERFAAIGE